MARWHSSVLVGFSLCAAVACSGKSSSDDDDGGAGGESGESTGGTGTKGGSSGLGGTGGGSAASGGTSGKGGGSSGLGGSAGTTTPDACGTLTSADARRIATSNLGNNLRDAVSAVAFAEGSQLIGRVLAAGDAPGSMKFVEEARESIDEWLDELGTKILADGNVESQTSSSVTYRMTSAVYCAPDPDDLANDPEWAAEMQADCADDLAEHPLRVVVTRVDCEQGETVKIVPELGEAHLKPLDLLASAHGLVATLDVAETVRYAQEQGNDAQFDPDSAGVIVANLDTSNPSESTLDVTLRTPLVLGVTEDEEHRRVTVDTASFQMSTDSVARLATASVDVGGTKLTATLRDLIEGVFQGSVVASVPRTSDILLDIPGVAGTCEYQNEHLACAGLGLGDGATTVSDATGALLTGDLNADAGRGFDLAFDLDESGNVLAKTSPVTLELGFALDAIQAELEEIQTFALDDRVTFAFTGEAPAATLFLNEDGDLALTRRTPGTEAHVDAGTFEMKSETYGQSVKVEAGQCLTFNTSSAVAHELLRGYNGSSCDLGF